MEKYYRNINNETFCFEYSANPYDWGHKNETLIEITKEECFKIEESKKILPIGSCEWYNFANIEDVKNFKRLELKNARDLEIYEPYLYTNGYSYDADLNSRNKLFQAQQLGVGVETNINWITADNQISSVSNADLVNIVNGIAYREQLAFNKFASKYTEVLNCINVDGIKLIKWQS